MLNKILLQITVFSLINFGSTCAFSNSEPFQLKGGVLEHNEIWAGEIIVEKPVIVPKGVILTIEPGTVVKFKHYRGYKERKATGLSTAGGTIKAIGTADKQIWFTSDAEDPINGDWAGIELGMTKDSVFKYVIVEFAYLGIGQYDSSVIVSHSIIRWNNSEGLYAERSSPVFEYNILYGNAYHEIALEQYNYDVKIRHNLFRDGHSAIHTEDSSAIIEENQFINYPQDVISPARSKVIFKRNRIEKIKNWDDALIISPDATFIEEDNDLGGTKLPSLTFDYKDIKGHELGYIPGDPEDRFNYIFDEVDETRRVIKKIGKGLGFGWSLVYANGYLWRFSFMQSIGDLSSFVRIDPKTGDYVKYRNDLTNPIPNPRGLTWDGEYFWVNDYGRLQLFQFTIVGDSIKVINSFDIPEKEKGAVNGLTSDGEFLYIQTRDEGGVFKIDKKGKIIDRIHFEPAIWGDFVWTGEYFWATSGSKKGIGKYTKDGKLVGEIYPPAVGVWAMAWDGKYLWTVQRTCEMWNEDKIYQIEILNDSLDLIEKRIEGDNKSGNVRVVRNLEYSEVDGYSLLLDLYLPEGRDKPLPVIIWIHAGGWVEGNKDSGPPFDMTQYGYAVASIDYRLSQQAKFPAQIQDVKTAVRWLRANVKEYNLDPDRFGAFGHSAGGHLSALLGTSGGVGALEGTGGNIKYSDRVQAVCDLSGPTDFTKVETSPQEKDNKFYEFWLWTTQLVGGPLYENTEKVKLANPVTHITKDDPPFLILHGKNDNLVPCSQSQLLYDALKGNGIEAELYIIDTGHGFDFNGSEQQYRSKIIEFFDRFLKTYSG